MALKHNGNIFSALADSGKKEKKKKGSSFQTVSALHRVCAQRIRPKCHDLFLLVVLSLLTTLILLTFRKILIS